MEIKIFSKITSKFQTTIPKEIRKKLQLTMHDSLEWTEDKGKIIIKPVKNDFLKYRGSIHTGPGNINEDIEKAKNK